MLRPQFPLGCLPLHYLLFHWKNHLDTIVILSRIFLGQASTHAEACCWSIDHFASLSALIHVWLGFNCLLNQADFFLLAKLPPKFYSKALTLVPYHLGSMSGWLMLAGPNNRSIILWSYLDSELCFIVGSVLMAKAWMMTMIKWDGRKLLAGGN